VSFAHVGTSFGGNRRAGLATSPERSLTGPLSSHMNLGLVYFSDCRFKGAQTFWHCKSARQLVTIPTGQKKLDKRPFLLRIKRLVNDLG
jgi:hypothetical protein